MLLMEALSNVVLMYYFVYRGTESLGIWTGRWEWGEEKRLDSLTKSKPLKLRLMAFPRAASNKDVNNGVASQEECYGRDYNVNTISDYAQ